jgi:hypothetical protein
MSCMALHSVDTNTTQAQLQSVPAESHDPIVSHLIGNSPTTWRFLHCRAPGHLLEQSKFYLQDSKSGYGSQKHMTWLKRCKTRTSLSEPIALLGTGGIKARLLTTSRHPIQLKGTSGNEQQTELEAATTPVLLYSFRMTVLILQAGMHIVTCNYSVLFHFRSQSAHPMLCWNQSCRPN